MIVARNCLESFEPDTMMKSSVPPHAAALPPLVAAYVEATNMPTAQEKPSSQCVAADPALVQFADLSTIPSSGELKAVRWLSS
jgi:hypothetical protein